MIIRSRQKLGKYRIERKLGEGGCAAVYQAMDTLEGVRVAIKVPSPRYSEAMFEDLRREVRIIAQLQHPNILPLKTAEIIDGRFVLVFPLGDRSLADRLQYRLSAQLALRYLDQVLDAVAYAHQRKILHCDIKPENMILFPENRLCLTDFGIARIALRTIQGSGSGTVGYIAPEQAMGRPSFRSDVFSIGLLGYRMFGGHWPEWPFTWPPPGIRRVRQLLHEDMIELLRRSLEVDPRKRFKDAGQMLSAFRRLRSRAVRSAGGTGPAQQGENGADWRTMRFRQFRRQFGKPLETTQQCPQCHGPVSEPMGWCPWCGEPQTGASGMTRFPQYCPRCERGLKLDWSYCPWCYGSGFEVEVNREYTDTRYVARCNNSECDRKLLMPFMRYCPWCRRKVTRKWKLPGVQATCHSCHWGVAEDFWSYCPWCGETI